MNSNLIVKQIARMEESPITFWQIGDNVYRVTNSERDANGLPMAKRWEASLECFLKYQAMGAFPYIKLVA